MRVRKLGAERVVDWEDEVCDGGMPAAVEDWVGMWDIGWERRGRQRSRA